MRRLALEGDQILLTPRRFSSRCPKTNFREVKNSGLPVFKMHQVFNGRKTHGKIDKPIDFVGFSRFARERQSLQKKLISWDSEAPTF
jgi:hypothetical protein